MGSSLEMRKILVAITTAGIVGLAGCGGGGGGGGGSSSTSPSDNESPTPEPEETIAAYFQAIKFDPEDIAYTGAGVNLAIYDGGILEGHTEFPSSRVSQFSGSFASELSQTGTETNHSWKLIDTEAFATDGYGVDLYQDFATRAHGSVVAGIAAGETTGLAKAATILAYDVTYTADDSGPGDTIIAIDPAGSQSDSIAAMLHIEKKGVSENVGGPGGLEIDFANVSLGEAFRYTKESAGNRETKSIYEGILNNTETAIVVAAGNDGLDMSSRSYALSEPVVYDTQLKELMVIVGATNQDGDQIWSNSDTPGSDTRLQERFLVAPGVAIEGADYRDANATMTQTGTSMAAPLVTGAAALVKEKFPQLTNRQVLQVLLDTANKSIPDYDVATHGQGLLDIDAALNVDASLYTTP